MPSPFPGMDPFLEHKRYFLDLHGSLITYLRETIQQKLSSPYFAVIKERLLVEATERHIEPDVDVITKNGRRPGQTESNGGVALLPATRSEPLLITVEHDDIKETFLEIRVPDEDDERVVTTVELLSLSNKGGNLRGRKQYLAKQKEILENQHVHLVEIDLLRKGRHTTGVDLKRLRRSARAFDYHVSIHLFHRRGSFLVYPVKLQDPLPEIPIPLLPKDPAIVVDLQTVFDRCYDLGPYRRRVRYDLRRLPRMNLDQKEWVRHQLEKQGHLADHTSRGGPGSIQK